MNPCGAVCDFGRRPYRTRARFRKGDPAETGIRWYICDHDARPLPFPSAIVNSDWEDNDLERDYGFDPNNVGEVREADRVAAFKDQPQGHTGAHQCGQPSWYVDGLPTDPPGTPVVYNADGLPVCCAPGRGLLWGRPQLPGRGGLLWGTAPPPVVSYIAGVGETFQRTLTQIGADLWVFSDGFSNYTLEGPTQGFHAHDWQLTIAISVFLNGVWYTDAWDGTGSRVFTFSSGVGFSSDTTVERV